MTLVGEFLQGITPGLGLVPSRICGMLESFPPAPGEEESET